jgi:magnesium and cobalt exporter, CNNM family
MWAIGSELAIVGFLLLLNGALAMAEMAVVSARRSRLRTRASSGDAGAAAALALLAEPTRFLSTVQIGITLIGILLGAVSGATLASEIRSWLQAVPGLAGYAQPISLVVVVGVTTYLSLVIGELVPKRIAQNAPEAIASAIARPMRLLATITAPLVAILTLTTEGVLRVLRVHASGEPALTEEDVRLLIVQGTEAGVIQAGERQVVEAAFELGDREVRELMTPRVLVTWLDLEAEREAAVAEMANSPHHYYPVCQGELDRVAGVLATRDLMPRLLTGGEFDLAALLRPALFLPERLPAYSALDEFKRAGTRMALVVDEQGGVEGVLTTTDLLEILAGESAATGSGGMQEPIRRHDGSWSLDGLMPVHEAADLLGVRPLRDESKDILTLGGMAMARIGRIPTAGDRFEWQGVSFEVVEMSGRRVDKLLAIPPVPPDEPNSP